MSYKKEDFLCLSAMLRAREAKMLNAEKADRMLDAPGFTECAKLLADSGYDDMSNLTASEIESALAKRLAAQFSELASLAPDEAYVDVFRLKYDYHNAKTIIKSEAMGLEPERLLSAAGRVPEQKLLEAYREERSADLPEGLAQAMREARGVLARTEDPQKADFVLDKAYFAELRQIAEPLKSEFLDGYVQILIDAANLKAAVRTMRMGRGEEFLRQALCEGGEVDCDRIAQAKEPSAIAEAFAQSRLSSAAAEAAAAASGGSMTRFELACDNAVTAYLQQAKLAAYGEEALLAHLAALEGETTAVRMILTGRLTGVKPEVLKERLREFYA